MRIIRTCSFCFVFAMAVSAFGAEAEYVGGTVKSIPENTAGKLDLSDAKDLVFVYGRGVYRLPFTNIKNYEITSATANRRVFGRVSVPHMPWAKQGEVVNLSFQTEDELVGVLSFRITAKDLASTEWALKSRIENPKEVASGGNRTRLMDTWWGDRYWRTTRNIANAQAQADAAGTQ